MFSVFRLRRVFALDFVESCDGVFERRLFTITFARFSQLQKPLDNQPLNSR